MKYKDKLRMPLCFALLFAVMLIIIYLLLGDEYVFGSFIDWNSQHGVLPDYFRQKFYETGSLTGGLALELGGGLNPYSLAYHGMLNPVLLISYLMPGVEMYDYITVSSVILLFVSLVLLYIWLRQNGFSQPIAFMASVMLAFSAPFLFHFHKQVMFVDYFPFLILSLIGIDRMFTRKKHTLFTVAFTLSLLVSFFFAISLTVTVSVYFFYKLLQQERRSLGTVCGFALSGISACLITCVVTLPAFFAVLNGRESNTDAQSLSFAELFLPDIALSKLTYSHYGAGLTVLVLFSLFALLFLKKAHTTFLSVSLTLLSLFPVFSYAMNAFLYDRGKAFIALLPLLILVVCIFLRDGKQLKLPVYVWSLCAAAIIIAAAVDKSHYFIVILIDTLAALVFIFWWKFRSSRLPLCIFTAMTMITTCIVGNYSDAGEYLKRSSYDDLSSPVRAELLSEYAGYGDTVRVADLTGSWYTCNRTYGSRLLRASVYSSGSNKAYLSLMHDELCLTSPSPHRIVVADTNNILYSTLMGQRWLIGKASTDISGYEYVADRDGLYLYKNENAYSLGFAAKKRMSVREFEELSPADRQLALLGYAVVDDTLPDVYRSPFKKLSVGMSDVKIDCDKKTKRSLSVSGGDNIYAVHISFDKTYYRHKTITVNGIKNVYAGTEGAFPNRNSDMWYIVSDGKDTLDFSFGAGTYTVPDIEVYEAPASVLEEIRQQITMADSISYDGKSTVSATVNADSDSTFLFTIPKDRGFTLYVDGKKTQWQTVDLAFVGCQLTKGQHELTLKYTPPYAAAGAVLSAAGILVAVCMLLYDNKKGRDRK